MLHPSDKVRETYADQRSIGYLSPLIHLPSKLDKTLQDPSQHVVAAASGSNGTTGEEDLDPELINACAAGFLHVTEVDLVSSLNGCAGN